MGTFTENIATPVYPATIDKLETSTAVLGGGDSAPSNLPLKQIVDRTTFLKKAVDDLADGTGIEDYSIAAIKLARGVLPASMRNCVLSGPWSTTTGAPQTIVAGPTTASVRVNGSVIPIRMTFSAGWDADRQVDFQEDYTLNSTVTISSFPGSGDVFIICTRLSNGTLVLSGNQGPFVYGPVPPSSDQNFWFNTVTMRWNVWASGPGGFNWQLVNMVILGRVERISGLVSQILPAPFRESLESTIAIPAGQIMSAYIDPTTPPVGWLHCNGALLSKAVYGRLYRAMGLNNTGASFQIPDLRGEFIRGLDAGRGIDTGRPLGTSQGHQLQNHRHVFNYADNNAGAGSAILTQSGSGPADTVGVKVSNVITTGVNAANAGAETRPRNVALAFFIKF